MGRLLGFKRSLPWIGRLYREREALRQVVQNIEACQAEESERHKELQLDLAQMHAELDTANRRFQEQERSFLKMASWMNQDRTQDFSLHLTKPFKEFLRLVRPMTATGKRKRRVGASGDGGYVMVDDFSAIRHAISVGIGGDVSWDLEIANYGISVHQFDPTVPGPPEGHANFHFHQRALRPEAEDNSETLDTIVRRLNGPLVAKIDIEGDEWEVFASVAPEALSPFRQIAVEFHGTSAFLDAAWRERALTALGNLNRGFQSVHIHGNNYAPVDVVAGFPFPRVFEVTFLNREGNSFEPDPDVYPSSLDRPNEVQWADIHLGTMDRL